MTDDTPDDISGEALSHVAGEQLTIRGSQVARVEAAQADVADSQIGSLASDRAEVSDSKIGMVIARELQVDRTEAGIVIAFSTNGAVRAQIDARAIAAAAGMFAAVLFVLGRLFRRG